MVGNNNIVDNYGDPVDPKDEVIEELVEEVE